MSDILYDKIVAEILLYLALGYSTKRLRIYLSKKDYKLLEDKYKDIKEIYHVPIKVVHGRDKPAVMVEVI